MSKHSLVCFFPSSMLTQSDGMVMSFFSFIFLNLNRLPHIKLGLCLNNCRRWHEDSVCAKGGTLFWTFRKVEKNGNDERNKCVNN